MLTHDARTRDVLAELIRSAADEVVTLHYGRLSQEPQITSKIADRIEQQLNGLIIFDHKVDVIVTDMPDRGPGSLEKRTGADLFVAIRVHSEDDVVNVAKGLTIQSKMSGERGKDDKQLMGQCQQMVKRSSKGSYVWLYSATGVRSIPASEVLTQPSASVESLASRNVAEQFRDVLDCVAGDEMLANQAIFESPNALRTFMEDLGAEKAVAIDVTSPPVFF